MPERTGKRYFVEITPDINQALIREATRLVLSKSDVARRAIIEYLQRAKANPLPGVEALEQ